jgi:hypothetical protein
VPTGVPPHRVIKDRAGYGVRAPAVAQESPLTRWRTVTAAEDHVRPASDTARDRYGRRGAAEPGVSFRSGRSARESDVTRLTVPVLQSIEPDSLKASLMLLRGSTTRP